MDTQEDTFNGSEIALSLQEYKKKSKKSWWKPKKTTSIHETSDIELEDLSSGDVQLYIDTEQDFYQSNSVEKLKKIKSLFKDQK